MTHNLAIIFGAYMLAAGVGLCLSPERASRIIDDFEGSAALSYLGGAIIIMLGVALILTHNIWQGWPEILITLIGWGAAIEGALILIFPKAFLGFTKKLMPNEGLIRAFGVIAIALGGALIWL